MTDPFLTFPFPGVLGRLVLFVTFFAHFVFVLLTVGTGIVAALLFIRRIAHPENDGRLCGRRVLHGFLPLKSLAVVLGVGPLLTMQVFHTPSFFAGIHAFAPFWLALIVIMILAFLFLELVAEGVIRDPATSAVLEVLGIVLLLAIPAVFVAVLLGAEDVMRPWLWAARYLHVLGAAAIVGLLVYYFRLRDSHAAVAAFLSKAALAAVGIQIAVGFVLFLLLPAPGTVQARFVLLAGVAGACLMLGYPLLSGAEVRLTRVIALLTLTVVPMLVFRQHLQDSAIGPLEEHAVRDEARPAATEALATYTADLKPRWENGASIYASSCSFCHGAEGDGHGPDAAQLMIPAEKIAAIRTHGPILRSHILDGVPGSGMPYFSILTAGQADMLIEYLNRRFAIASDPGQPATRVDSRDCLEAAQIYTNACAVCHGSSGKPSEYGRALRPPPPNLSAYTFTPSRIFEVVTDGYPGTEMRAFSSLRMPVRWGLVETVSGLYKSR